MNNYTIINVTSFKFHVSGYTKSPARLVRGTGVIQNCKVHFAKCRYITKNGYTICVYHGKVVFLQCHSKTPIKQ